MAGGASCGGVAAVAEIAIVTTAAVAAATTAHVAAIPLCMSPPRLSLRANAHHRTGTPAGYATGLGFPNGDVNRPLADRIRRTRVPAVSRGIPARPACGRRAGLPILFVRGAPTSHVPLRVHRRTALPAVDGLARCPVADPSPPARGSPDAAPCARTDFDARPRA